MEILQKVNCDECEIWPQRCYVYYYIAAHDLPLIYFQKIRIKWIKKIACI